MASWFYLYLFTEEKPAATDYFFATIEKHSEIKKVLGMSNGVYQKINIDEGTTHWVDVSIENVDGSVLDLTGCTAVFTSMDIEKACVITNNSIRVKLEPEDTVGYLSRGYQIRVFDSDGDVFQIIQGTIYIRKAHAPYIRNPLTGGES